MDGKMVDKIVGAVEKLATAINGNSKSNETRKLSVGLTDKYIDRDLDIDSIFSIQVGKTLPAGIDSKEFMKEFTTLTKQAQYLINKWEDDFVNEKKRIKNV